MTDKKYDVGDYLFCISEKQFFVLSNIDLPNNSFAYWFNNGNRGIKHSFWVRFDDEHLVKMYESGDLIHIKTEQERLAIQLKYSSAF